MAAAPPRERGRRGHCRAGAVAERRVSGADRTGRCGRGRVGPARAPSQHNSLLCLLPSECLQPRTLESTAKFSTGQVQVSRPFPAAAGRGWLGARLVLCLLERSNIYTFVISYLNPQGDLTYRKPTHFLTTDCGAPAPSPREATWRGGARPLEAITARPRPRLWDSKGFSSESIFSATRTRVPPAAARRSRESAACGRAPHCPPYAAPRKQSRAGQGLAGPGRRHSEVLACVRRGVAVRAHELDPAAPSSGPSPVLGLRLQHWNKHSIISLFYLFI